MLASRKTLLEKHIMYSNVRQAGRRLVFMISECSACAFEPAKAMSGARLHERNGFECGR